MKKINIFKLLTIFSCILFIAGCGDKRKSFTDGTQAQIKLGEKVLEVEVVVTDKAKAQGLSNRKKLPFEGMLFIFNYPHQLTFWMKDMNFPIDIVWVNKNKIVNITKNAKPEPNTPEHLLKIYSSVYFADTAVELNAGDADKYNLQKGMKFKILK